MVIYENKWGFTTARVILDDEAARTLCDRGLSRLIVVTLHRLDLPGFTVKEKDTGIIDLGTSVDDVKASFGKTVRNEISRTERDDQFRFVTTEGPFPDDAYEQYVAFERARGAKPFGKDTFDGLVFVRGYYGGKLLACISAFPSKPVARIRSIFSARHEAVDDETYTRIGYASKRAMLELCRWGIEHERSGIDLASINMHEDAKSGIAAYKRSFSPRMVKEYTYTKRSGIYAFFERIRAKIA